MRKQKIIGMTLAAGLLVSSLYTNGTVNCKTTVSEQSYVIMTNSAKDTAILEKKYDLSDHNTADTILTAELTEEEARHLSQEPLTTIVERDVAVTGSDTYSVEREYKEVKENDAEWNMQMVNADQAETVSTGKNKVKVAIIDSGIDFIDDVDVKERKNFIPGDENISALYEDSSGHGTSVAGIIAAKDDDEGISGVNDEVELYSARVLDANNSAPVSRVIEAVQWAMEKDVDIINMSLGTKQYSSALRKVLQQAHKQGILIIASAGNGGSVEYPAAFDEVMAIGSVGADGIVSEDSSTGTEIDVVAPGEQISSTGAFDGIMISGGTSMAAPHVTGIASVLLAKNKDVPVDFIRSLICASAKPTGDREKYGAGIVDLQYALDHYDEAWENYCQTSHSDSKEEAVLIEENTEDLECFDNVNTVEGRWGAAAHQECAGAGSLSGTDLKVLKVGAVLQDKSYTGLNGKGAHPAFHGNHFALNPAKYVNYIACYLILSKMAVSYKSGSYSDPAKVGNLNSLAYDDLTKNIGGGIGDASWDEVLTDNGYTKSSKNKSLILYGMALHNATDAFSHSACIGGKRLTNEQGDSTSATYSGSQRLNSAKYVAKKLITHLNNGARGYVADFAVPSGTHGGKFKMAFISEFARNINSTTYSENKSAFDALNITSFSVPQNND